MSEKLRIARAAIQELHLIEPEIADPRVSIRKIKEILTDYFEAVEVREMRKSNE